MKRSRIMAGAVGLLALLWILSGVLLSDDEVLPSAVPEEVSEALEIDVRVRDLQAESFTNHIVVTGRTQPSRDVELKAETAGQVIEILKEEGVFVQAGEVLAKIELRDRNARVQEAKEFIAQRRIQYNAAKSLETKGFNSKISLAQAKANLENAKAELENAQSDLGKTGIKAPFDGLINEQVIEIGDFVSSGDPVFTIVDLDPLEIQAFVSERQVGDINPGAQVVAEYIDGRTLEGSVSFISASADDQTRTFRIVVNVDNADLSAKGGFTTTLKIPTQPQAAYKISPSVLALNDAGVIGVKTVDDSGLVQFMPVEILADLPEHMWVGGLPDHVRLITVGQNFVKSGQKVRPVPAEGEGLL